MKLKHLLLLSTLAPLPARAVDLNGNGLSDIWEFYLSASPVDPAADADGDGVSNLQEHAAGTDPADFWSRPELNLEGGVLRWAGQPGKVYTVEGSSVLGLWEPAAAPFLAEAESGSLPLPPPPPSGRAFFRLSAADTDSDGDGLTDWEELALGLNARQSHTDREQTTDSAQVTAALGAADELTVTVCDDVTAERWPEPAVFAIRRTGGLGPLTARYSLSGSAVAGTDYQTIPPGGTVSFRSGEREAYVEIRALPDDTTGEPPESVILTLTADPAHTVGAAASAEVTVEDTGDAPSAKEAARFLLQAAFGPDQDSTDDPDSIPENVEALMASGFDAWISDQFTRPVSRLRPFVEWCGEHENDMELYGDWKQWAWWNRAMGVRRLRPDAPEEQAPDPLRQRVAFALSQIFVISDRMEDLAVSPEGMAHFYDTLLEHSFGNYRDVLRAVTLHPCMGMYLSHLGNRKPDPVNGIHPDENYAREVMQLFTIGLWMLNPDGTRAADAEGRFIPTYNNGDITEFARVFTGLAFGGPESVNFGIWPRSFVHPMKGWDEEHDLEPKKLLRGLTTPARAASPGNTGTATLADVDAAMDNLFQHPNTGPFVCRRLIQRMVTSNPSPAYIARAAAAFTDNGQGVRGDLKAVTRAILMDPEARAFAVREGPTFGKAREPFLRCVNFATAFNAAAEVDWYVLDNFNLDHFEEPLHAPSVFNFYLPDYSPPGALTEAGLTGPEFQLLNATSAVMGPNYFWNAIPGGLNRWGVARAERAVRLNLVPEMALTVPPGTPPEEPVPNVEPLDPLPLIRRLDLSMTGGTLAPEQYRIIATALNRVHAPTWEWPKKRLQLAISLIAASPEFNVLR